MKQALFLLSALTSLALSSCVKEYNCHCTYVASSLGPNAGDPDIVEHTTIEARVKEDADVECLSRVGKYTTQFYSGTCNASR